VSYDFSRCEKIIFLEHNLTLDNLQKVARSIENKANNIIDEGRIRPSSKDIAKWSWKLRYTTNNIKYILYYFLFIFKTVNNILLFF
jgi:hypothetical protein